MRFSVRSNQCLAPLVYRMRLEGDTRTILRPGQFVQIQLPGFYLRRPISVCDWQAGEKGALEIVYKVVGRGTEALSKQEAGTELDLLTGLGNGYELEAEEGKSMVAPLLVGGGVGIPPLFGLCKRLVEAGKKPVAVLGFNTESEVFLYQEFQALGIATHLCTLDGSAGREGFVTDAMRDLQGQYDYVFTCGPEPMLKAVYALCQSTGGQFSFEERMACGFGVCMGCSCKTRYASKRICKDGPVLQREEILW